MKRRSQCLPQPARVGQNPQPQRDGGQGQQDVYQREAQHHLDDHVEDEEAVDEVEDRQQQGHAHAPGVDCGQQRSQRGAEHVARGHVEGDGDEAGHGVGHVQDQGAPPEGRRCGDESQDQTGDHLPPSRLLAAQVFAHDEAQPHPAEDDDEGAGGDGPDDHPCVLDQVVGVGEVGGCAGEDVAHDPESLRQLSASSPDALSTTPQRVPWTPSTIQPAKALAQRPGLRAASTLSQMRPGWWMGTTA